MMPFSLHPTRMARPQTSPATLQTCRRRGAAATELAVALPVLLMMTLGCVDFGRFAYSYIAVTNAARAGAAYGIMNNYTPSTQAAWQANIASAATSESSLSGVSVSVTSPTADANGLRRVQVTASYTFQTIVTWPGIPKSTSMKRMVEMRLIR